MDARKVHELFLSQYEQNAGDTTPVTRNIDFKNTANSLHQTPQPVQAKSNIDRKKIGRIALGVGVALLSIYLLREMSKKNSSPTFSKRRKLQKKDSLDNDLG